MDEIYLSRANRIWTRACSCIAPERLLFSHFLRVPLNSVWSFVFGVQLKKSRSDMEDRRRKSLLPWHRKNRSKSKDRGETEYSKGQTQREHEAEDTVSIRSDVTSSRSSLASWDLRTGPFARQVRISSVGWMTQTWTWLHSTAKFWQAFVTCVCLALLFRKLSPLKLSNLGIFCLNEIKSC